jgi:hypothetical protein
MNIERIIRDVLTVGGIAGIIALIITGSICYKYVHDGDHQIPQILTYALTTIIGFYFGTKAPMNAQTQENPPTS